MAESLPISGQIDPKSFPFLLVDLHRQSATGSLKVEGDNHQKALYFRGGRILFASSNDPKDQLGAILIESGKITEQQLEDVNHKVGPGNPLAKALSDSGIVSQRELSEAARAKVECILSDVLSATAGSFEFEDGVLPKGAVDLKLAPERLMMAAVRRVADRAFVLRHLDGLDAVLSPKPELRQKLPEIESELFGLTDHLDGQQSLKEAAGRAGLDEFEAAKIACGLVLLGLAEKGEAPVVVDAAEASPFFVPPEGGSELDLGQSSEASFGTAEPPTVAFGMAASSPGDPEATVVMGELPDFSLPSLSSPPAPDPATLNAAMLELAPPPLAASNVPPPLKIIAPPRSAERTRPPAKPSKADMAALDELLGKRSPEGPLTPIHKPAQEWKPTFLPAEQSRGRKRRGSAAGGRKLLLGTGAGVLILAAGAGGWWLWAGRRSDAQPKVVTSRSPQPAASPSAASDASPSAGAPSTSTSPTPISSAAAPVVTATSSAKPAAVVSPSGPAPTATTMPAAKPAAAKAAPPASTSAPAGIAEARTLLRKSQFDDAARAFQSHFKSSRASYSVQILVACSTETLQKAASAVPADDLYVLPVHYKGKDCYRLGWGLYESEAKANAGARSVPDYFRHGGARPKVVAVAELLR